MTHKGPDEASIKGINKRFECKFDINPNVSIEVAAFSLGISGVLHEIAVDLNYRGLTGGSPAAAIDKLEEIHKFLLTRLRAV